MVIGKNGKNLVIEKSLRNQLSEQETFGNFGFERANLWKKKKVE